jgi:hypothetical protein
MKSLRRHLPVALGLIAVIALYSWACADDMRAEKQDADYTAEIMEHAKQEALAKAEYNALVKRADDMLALGEMK